MLYEMPPILKCEWGIVRDRAWRCSRCGRVVVAAVGPDGTVIEPRWANMPPCGWKPLTYQSGGHAWVEQYAPDAPRRFTCGRCRATVEFEGDDSQLRNQLDNQPDCKAAEVSRSAGSEPTVSGKAKHYLSAVARWIAAGFPKRSDEEVDRIYAVCQQCEAFHADGYCRKCGCCLNRSRHAMANKIRMATEHCPLPEPKW